MKPRKDKIGFIPLTIIPCVVEVCFRGNYCGKNCHYLRDNNSCFHSESCIRYNSSVYKDTRYKKRVKLFRAGECRKEFGGFKEEEEDICGKD